jgi:predicted secreted Zn-dependent protease
MPVSRQISLNIAACLALILQSAGQASSAEPTVEVNVEYYNVSGASGRQLKKQMKSLGPNGYWAYTRWRIHWSADCKVKLTVNYTFPRLANRDAVPLPLRQNWDAMVVALKAHEEKHGGFGRGAANEISKADCKGAKGIIRKWSRKDDLLDSATVHGRTEGVVLPN